MLVPQAGAVLVERAPVGTIADTHSARGTPRESGFTFAFLIFSIAAIAVTADDVAARAGIFVGTAADTSSGRRVPGIACGTFTLLIFVVTAVAVTASYIAT